MRLDRRRLTVYPYFFIALYLALWGWWVLGGSGRLDRSGKPIGVDFITFYAASILVDRGDAPGAWNLARITAVEREVIGAEIPPFAFHYPPTFLLALVPLAHVPYLWALAAWWATTTVAFVAVVRRIAPHALTAGLAVAFPGFFQNLVQGQNGALTTALLGAGLLLVDTRPAAGGAILGLLSYKPQLVPLVWLGLAAARRWVALAASVATAAAIAALSAAVLGVETWHAFQRNIPFAVDLLESEGVLPWFRMPTVQVSAMQLGASAGAARLLQVLSTMAAAAMVTWVWTRRAPLAVRATTLACATLLGTPFAFDYDLAVLAIPIAFLGWEGVRAGFRPGETTVLALAWLAPLLAPAIAEHTRVQLTPLLLVALATIAIRRTRYPSPAS